MVLQALRDGPSIRCVPVSGGCGPSAGPGNTCRTVFRHAHQGFQFMVFRLIEQSSGGGSGRPQKPFPESSGRGTGTFGKGFSGCPGCPAMFGRIQSLHENHLFHITVQGVGGEQHGNHLGVWQAPVERCEGRGRPPSARPGRSSSGHFKCMLDPWVSFVFCQFWFRLDWKIYVWVLDGPGSPRSPSKCPSRRRRAFRRVSGALGPPSPQRQCLI